MYAAPSLVIKGAEMLQEDNPHSTLIQIPALTMFPKSVLSRLCDSNLKCILLTSYVTLLDLSQEGKSYE